MSVKRFLIFSFVFTSILGTFLHFTYELSGNNVIISLFSSINESVWEHLKLLFFPMLITTLIGAYYYRNNISNFLCSKTVGIIVAMLFTVFFFYIYSGILGKNIAVIDILTFYIAAALGEFVAYRLIKKPLKCNNSTAIVILSVLLIYFIIFTFNPPNIGLFENPVEQNKRSAFIEQYRAINIFYCLILALARVKLFVRQNLLRKFCVQCIFI